MRAEDLESRTGPSATDTPAGGAPGMDAEPMRMALRRLGILRRGENVILTPLPGGIASDIWKVELPGRSLCIKRALHRLKVKADWFVPVERNLYEWLYLEIAERAVPGSAPGLVARDTDEYLFVMEYLPPELYPLWKHQLRDGLADSAFAAEVGRRLATIHRYTAARPELEREFPTDDIFYASRMESYLEATARAHPDLAPCIMPLIHATMHTKHALVHGDVSPKNILNGQRGPVLLDPECAFYGDPAFDLAFCLNHLLLKCLWNPAARDGFLACFTSLADAYLPLVDWEPREEMEARAARLLPGLFLARIDGKSPVEYVTDEEDKELVRRTARSLLTHPVERLLMVSDAWRAGLEEREQICRR